MFKKLLLVGFLIAAPITHAMAQSPILVDPHTGRYLGNLNANQFDPNSVSNPFGQYGSQFAPNSINNPFGPYGSRFSPQGVTNPYATGAPIIVAPSPSPFASH